jgi:nitrogenase molybdenum-iron protein alpha/beta subunit
VTFSGTTNIGAATATTPSSGDNSTKVATTAYVQAALSGISLSGYATETYVDNAVAALVDSAPAALDTLNELAAALGDDANFATTISTSLGEKLVKASNLSDLTDAATARTNLGLGSMAVQNANSVNITGGTIDGVTIDGGSYS